jgi:protein LTV1
VDVLFEAMARGYDSDEIGELDEDDPRISGGAEIERFGAVLEEFRREREPAPYKTAFEVARDGANAEEPHPNPPASFFEDGGTDTEAEFGSRQKNPAALREIAREDARDAFQAMLATRRRAGLEIPDRLMQNMRLCERRDATGEGGGVGADADADSRIGNADPVARRFELVDAEPSAAPGGDEIEYLRNAPRDDWDCETIVSTYSNLENHPSVIDAPRNGTKSRGKRFLRGVEVKSASRGEGEGEGGDSASGASLIRLSESNGLPVDYVQSRRGKARGGSNLTAANLAAIGEEACEFSDDASEPGEEWRSNIRRRGETPEEKKARKASVKAGRRDARAAKKGLKTTFKNEEREMDKKKIVGDIRPGVSITQLG